MPTPAYAVTFQYKSTPVVSSTWLNAIVAAVSRIQDVRAWGAVGDGTTDDSVAFQLAASAASGGGEVFVPTGHYLITTPILVGSNTLIRGEGGSTIYLPATPIAAAFYANVTSNVTVENLNFDLGFTRAPAYSNYANGIQNCGVFGNNSTNLKVINCNFSQLYTVAIQYYTGDTLEVRGCTFDSPAQTQQLHLEFIWILTVSGLVLIKNNSCINHGADPASGVCAVFASGTTGPVVIEDVWTTNCGRDNTGSHRLETFAFYGNSVDVRVEDCFSFNELSAWLRLANVGRARIVNNYAEVIATGAQIDTALINTYGDTTYAGVGQTGNQDIQILGNTLVNPTTYTGRIAIQVTALDWSVPSTNIVIQGNTTSGFHLMVDVYGPLRNVRVEKNTSVSVNGGQIQFEAGSGITALNGVTEAQSFYDGLYVNDNYIQDTGSSNLNGIVVNMTYSPEYTGTLGQIEIHRNRCEATVGSAGQGISIRGVNPANSLTRAALRGNEVSGYGIGIYPRFCQEVVVEENRLVGNTTPITQSGNTMYVGSGNRFASGGIYQGQAVLSSGTVTVSTAEVVAGDSILYSNVKLGGTPGILNIGAIVAGTSFVIHSSNGADTSTVAWKFDH